MLISVIITLIMLQIVVMGMVVLASRDSSLSKLRLENAQAEAAAIAGADMALKEIYDNVDLDGDGGIGTISNDGNAANDPTVNFGEDDLAWPPSGQRFGVQARAGSTRVWYELSVDQASAPIEGFESYAVGLALNNVGGWAPWDGSASAVGYASNTRARSGAMSQDIRSTSDSVKTYTPTSGTWTYTAWQFIPTAATGAGTYIILMNKYVSGGAKSWSTQIHFNLSTNKCYDDLTGSVTGSQVAIVRNQWIKIQIDIDLNAGWQTVKYNGNAWSALNAQGKYALRGRGPVRQLGRSRLLRRPAARGLRRGHEHQGPVVDGRAAHALRRDAKPATDDPGKGSGRNNFALSSAHCFSVKLPPRVSPFCSLGSTTLLSGRAAARTMWVLASRLSSMLTRMASGVMGTLAAPNSGMPWWERMMCWRTMTRLGGRRWPVSRMTCWALSWSMMAPSTMWPMSSPRSE